MVLVEDSIAVRVSLFEKLDEVGQELLVLLQLEIEHTLEEDCEFQLAGLCVVVLLVVHHSSCHCSPSRGAALIRVVAHQVGARGSYAPADLSHRALLHIVLLLCEQLLVELGLEDPVVIFIVHLLNDALPLPILNEALA